MKKKTYKTPVKKCGKDKKVAPGAEWDVAGAKTEVESEEMT